MNVGALISLRPKKTSGFLMGGGTRNRHRIPLIKRIRYMLDREWRELKKESSTPHAHRLTFGAGA